MASEDFATVCVVGFRRAASFGERVAWVATLAQHEEDAQFDRAKKARWWADALLKCAPVLSGGHGTWRGGKCYGKSSGYGRFHAGGCPSTSPAEFYENFRYTREDIPRLYKALRLPGRIITQSGCNIDGEEALLVFLKVSSTRCMRARW